MQFMWQNKVWGTSTSWGSLRRNPLFIQHCSCMKPSLLWDVAQCQWMLCYLLLILAVSVDALLPSPFLGCVSGCFATFSLSWLCQWMLSYFLLILAVLVDALLPSLYLGCVSGCFATFSFSWLCQWMLCYLLFILAGNFRCRCRVELTTFVLDICEVPPEFVY